MSFSTQSKEISLLVSFMLALEIISWSTSVMVRHWFFSLYGLMVSCEITREIAAPSYTIGALPSHI